MPTLTSEELRCEKQKKDQACSITMCELYDLSGERNDTLKTGSTYVAYRVKLKSNTRLSTHLLSSPQSIWNPNWVRKQMKLSAKHVSKDIQTSDVIAVISLTVSSNVTSENAQNVLWRIANCWIMFKQVMPSLNLLFLYHVFNIKIWAGPNIGPNTTYRMSGCRLSLRCKTWTEVRGGRQPFEGETEFIVKCIEGIVKTTLQE